jgi:hypothetical protein
MLALGLRAQVEDPAGEADGLRHIGRPIRGRSRSGNPTGRTFEEKNEEIPVNIGSRLFA